MNENDDIGWEETVGSDAVGVARKENPDVTGGADSSGAAGAPVIKLNPVVQQRLKNQYIDKFDRELVTISYHYLRE